jgi:hypothetical protein
MTEEIKRAILPDGGSSRSERNTRFGVDHPAGVVDVTIYQVLADGKGIRTLGLASYPLANLPDIADELIDLVEGAEMEEGHNV